MLPGQTNKVGREYQIDFENIHDFICDAWLDIFTLYFLQEKPWQCSRNKETNLTINNQTVSTDFP